jgi:hypothetical protein
MFAAGRLKISLKVKQTMALALLVEARRLPSSHPVDNNFASKGFARICMGLGPGQDGYHALLPFQQLHYSTAVKTCQTPRSTSSFNIQQDAHACRRPRHQPFTQSVNLRPRVLNCQVSNGRGRLTEPVNNVSKRVYDPAV